MELNIKIIKEFLGISYKKSIKLTFNQAKMIDIVLFIDQTKDSKFDLWLWVLDFCKQHGKVKQSDESSIYLWGGLIFEQLKNTYFKWLFKESKAKWDDSPIISLITFIAKESAISSLDILYKMTYEEFQMIVEWVIWNLNEMTAKGKSRNRLRMIYAKKEKRSEEEKQEIKDKLEKLKTLT